MYLSLIKIYSYVLKTLVSKNGIEKKNKQQMFNYILHGIRSMLNRGSRFEIELKTFQICITVRSRKVRSAMYSLYLYNYITMLVYYHIIVVYTTSIHCSGGNY